MCCVLGRIGSPSLCADLQDHLLIQSMCPTLAGGHFVGGAHRTLKTAEGPTDLAKGLNGVI